LERTTKLFNGHGTLIRLFIQFLPPGHVMKQNEKDAACFEITTPTGDHIIVDSSRGEIIES
jgi:histone deacetylase complex regulatory component SIN3